MLIDVKILVFMPKIHGNHIHHVIQVFHKLDVREIEGVTNEEVSRKRICNVFYGFQFNIQLEPFHKNLRNITQWRLGVYN